ncbi:MAG TPA: hypothetical protein VJ837_03085 [Candidatus Paceibacterota bacterium]|nr:hypothetical protein [Candidatus Paceibacterota bacterium]
MRFAHRLLVILLMSAVLAAPFRFAALQAQAFSLNPADLIPADKLLPDGLISEENREELEKSFQKGVAACAVMTFIMFIIDGGSFKVPTSQLTSELKEIFIDCIMYHVVNVLIEDMLRSLTTWVQGGFKGNPVFVTRLDGYMRNLADQVAGEFLDSVDLSFCSPFRAQIRIQLLNAYREARGDLFNPSCTFTQSLDNIQRFVDGDFRAGGWNSWLEMWSDPSNNPYGAYIESLNELSLRISGATSEATLDINLGNGFLSRKRQQCYDVYEDPNDPKVIITDVLPPNFVGPPRGRLECDEPEIVTPGSFIEKQINEKYGSPGRRLEMADEMNELINAVVLFLVGNIFKDEDGLSGYSFSDVGPVDLLDPTIDDTLPDGSAPGRDTIPPGPPGTPYVFTEDGVFHAPTPGNETGIVRINLPEEGVSYGRMTVTFDVINNGWGPKSDGRHMLFQMSRVNQNQTFGWLDLYGYANALGPNRNQATLSHGVGLSTTQKIKAQGAFGMQIGERHRVEYVYDAAGRIITLTITDSSGEQMSRVTSFPNVSSINIGNKRFEILFGNPASENQSEPPSYGWQYSDLEVRFGEAGGGNGEGGDGTDGDDDGSAF